MSNNLVHIDAFTTMNDLHGGNDCPFSVRCEILDAETPSPSGWKTLKSVQVDFIPDEKALGNAISRYGFDPCTKFTLPAADGLARIYAILSKVAQGGYTVIGYSLVNHTMKALNAAFERVLQKQPIRFRDGTLIDVERLAKLAVPIVECGGYSRFAVRSCLLGPMAPSGFETLERDMAATMDILGGVMAKMGFNAPADVAKYLSTPQPLEHFQMGKYKGMPISEAFRSDRQYCSWILRNRNAFEGDIDMLKAVSDLMDSEAT